VSPQNNNLSTKHEDVELDEAEEGDIEGDFEEEEEEEDGADEDANEENDRDSQAKDGGAGNGPSNNDFDVGELLNIGSSVDMALMDAALGVDGRD